MAGQPTKLNDETQAVIIEAVKAGNYRATAAAKAGISRRTLARWEEWGASGQEPYAAFCHALERAEAESEATMLETVKAAKPGWQSKAWIMERRWPGRWAQKVRTVVAEEVASLTAAVKKSLDAETYSKVVDAVSQEPQAASTHNPH